MGHSSLLGADDADLTSDGRDTAALGPSDTSDTGSDVAGIELLDDADPAEPVDVALGEDRQRSTMPADALDGGASDAAGTGERRSAGADAGREASDISVDQVFSLDDTDEPMDGIEEVDAAEATDPLSDEVDPEEEDESADPVGDGYSDAESAARKNQPSPRRS